ncbi:MAG: LacI family DNA-binding transcriptional regulator [Blautia sp.]|nr:LacI family DNA-binding transcriptional regulator [Blautia sp.]
MPQKNVTFDDIAKYSGFSKTTISRYFNRPESLTEEHRNTIRKALEELDYKENKTGRILAKGTSECVGILMPSSRNFYYQEILSEILSTYDTYGYKFMVFTSDGNAETETRYIQELLAYKVEGLMIFSHTLPSSYLAKLPVPSVGVEREDEFISSVNCDNYMGAVQAVSLLARHNCDIFIHVNTPTPTSTPAFQRITGFQDFCQEHHLKYEVQMRDMGARSENMRVQLSSLLENLERVYPDQKIGIFFSSDNTANEFLKLLIRKYHTLPDRYRLVGFDGSYLGQQAVYSISSIGQQIEKTAHEALRLLIHMIRDTRETGSVPAPVHKVIPPVLLRRETTELYNRKD